MAPITRSSIHGARPVEQPDVVGTILKGVLTFTDLTRSQPEPADVEDEIEDEEMESDDEMISSELEDDMAEDDLSSPLQASAQELLRPLQETADRVSRQVEQFAQLLDQHLSKKNNNKEDPFKQTMVLMDEYAAITSRDSSQIATKTSSNKQSQKNRKSLGDSASQRQNILLESRLWTLNAKLLSCKDPEAEDQIQCAQVSILADLHRYSSDEDLWQAFLNVDPLASQCETILEWLQQWKKDISDVLQDSNLDSYQDAHRGQGLWAGGNIFTQASIKKQKVTRAYPGPLNPSPEVRTSHLRKADASLLVTQMDPDARTRQDASLEVEDEAFEVSAWHASWEMLRQGTPLSECRDWWQERNEDWRSLVLRNSSLTNEGAGADIWRRIANMASGREYLAACKYLTEHDSAMNKFEKAVYGIMCGSYTAAESACESLDDHFFALFNEILIERYGCFLEEYRKRLTDPAIKNYTPPPSTIRGVSQYFKAAQLDKSTKPECHQPYKYLEGMLISDDYQPFFIEMGRAAAKMAHLTGQSRHLFDKVEADVNECAQIAAQDEDVVRVTAHLQLALQPLGLLDEAFAQHRNILENNILNYIGLLERHGKYALIPLYTSRLSPDRQPRAIGRILSKVTEQRERDLQMRLMKQYGIDTSAVIYTICDYARLSWSLGLEASDIEVEPTKIIEYNDKKIGRIRGQFIGLMDENDPVAAVVKAYEWIRHLDAKNWGMAIWLMTVLYKDLLISGNIAAAKELAANVEFTSTSLRVTGMNLSIGAFALGELNAENGETHSGADGSDNDSVRLASPTKRRKELRPVHPLAEETTDRADLSMKSILWEQLQYLVTALQFLEEWQAEADAFDSLSRDNSLAMRDAKRRLTIALTNVDEAIRPLLEEDFLDRPFDESEDFDLKDIRDHYLPECVLAYNSALYFAGHCITRQRLTQCMDLAQKVARTGSLNKAFVNSKRMSELVEAFARDSQELLSAQEQRRKGRNRNLKRPPPGATEKPDIWQVTWEK